MTFTSLFLDEFEIQERNSFLETIVRELIYHGHRRSIHGVAQEMSTQFNVSFWRRVHGSQTLQDHGDASLIV